MNTNKQSTMRDKRNLDHVVDYTSTGPDRYFDESLQYPRLNKSSSSSFSFHIDRKSVFIPASYASELNYVSLQDMAKRSTFATTTTTHDSREPITKGLRDSPTDSPGSKGTTKTSECTDSDNDNDDYEDEVDSYCGSLTYSVESYALGPFPAEEFDEGYHAGDENTTNFDSSCSSLYDDDDQEDLYSHECFMGHPCSFLLGGIQEYIQKAFQELGSSHQGMARDDFERNLQERRRLYPSNNQFQQTL